ncbi:LCP family protein [Paenibacillus methanolicus]|uniref:LCP family protein required for cell wall assembly n=1 Tax=Paenibacillus methanolicus TaxID=582686 RepID=A0A5S5C7S4_9BACL|nr:LCP family protein [Paenibacillus methanolicus]TYP75357.1 LCP family protein required for cell wall assembly [Paenibacillus methanolicus]
MATQPQPERKSRKWKWMAAVMAFVLVTGTLGYVNRATLASWGFDLFLADQVKKKLDQSYKPLEGREVKRVAQTKKEDPFTLLLLGVDQRDQEIGRSDTMIYTVVRPSDGAMLMISIPRDTYAIIVGKTKKNGEPWEDKITHAYAFGGPAMSVETVEKLFGSHVDHYATINFNGFRDVIDAMGGIALPITEDLVNDDADHEKFVVKAGQDKYNGKDALNYVRYREDAGGDMSRTGRHQIFLNAIMEKASKVGQWTKIPELIDIMGHNFSTDLTSTQMINLAKSMLQTETRTIYSHTLKGDGHRKSKGGAWYYFADETDLDAVGALIEAWLDPKLTKSQLPLPEEYEKSKAANTAATTMTVRSSAVSEAAAP